jgi:hypothetical protein
MPPDTLQSRLCRRLSFYNDAVKTARFGSRSIPIAFAVVTVAAYGLLLPFTGFYWDDWPFAWIARFLGPAAFIPAFQGFRPFLGPIFFLTSSLIPPNPLLWQAFALVIRFLAALSAWFALVQIWPHKRRQAVIVALLFLVFPAYSQHWVAYTHINQEWLPFICYLLSIGFSARALRQPASFWTSTICAVLFMAIGLFPTEYFIGLEPLRFLFLWVMVSEAAPGFKARLNRTLKAWWPYLLVWLTDLVWLLYYYKSGLYVSYDLTAAQSIPPLGESVLIFADAIWKAGLYGWIQVLALTAKSPGAPTSWLTLILVGVSFVVGAWYLHRLSIEESPALPIPDPNLSLNATAPAWFKRDMFPLSAIVIGAAGILLGRLPSYAAGLPLTLQSSFDRFMISMMLGGSLLIVGLVELSVRNRRARTYLFAGMLALGIGQQFFNGNIFRRDWQGQQQIYWQLAWRIPALQPHTAIITQQMPLDYETDLSMTAALNWIYAAEIQPPDLPYALVYTEKRLGGGVLPSLKSNTAMHLPYRNVSFAGNTSQTVAIYVPRSGCLRVFDPRLGDADTYSSLPASLTAPIPLSNPDLILGAAPVRGLPNPPFQGEPAHTWCYFYEKAELARQLADWSSIVQLGSQAARQGFSPQDPFEWLPFMEAYARTGDLVAAEAMTRKVWAEAPKTHRGLCLLWDRVKGAGPGVARDLATKLTGEFSCGH